LGTEAAIAGIARADRVRAAGVAHEQSWGREARHPLGGGRERAARFGSTAACKFVVRRGHLRARGTRGLEA
jgi:hypothetical protein